MKFDILRFTRATLAAVLAWAGSVSAQSLLPGTFPGDAPVHGNLWNQA